MNTPTALFLCTLTLATAQLNNYPMWGGIGGTGGTGSMTGGTTGGMTGGMTGMGGIGGLGGLGGIGGMTGMGMDGMNPYISSFPFRVHGTPYSWMNPQMSNIGNSAIWRTHPLIRMTSVGSTGAPIAGTVGTHPSTIAGSIVPSGSEKTPIMPTPLPQNIINIPKVPGSEEILTHMVLSNSHPKPYLDTISDMLYNSDVTKTRSIGNSIYMGGMNPARNTPNVLDDCSPQDTTRWNRDLSEWVY